VLFISAANSKYDLSASAYRPSRSAVSAAAQSGWFTAGLLVITPPTGTGVLPDAGIVTSGSPGGAAGDSAGPGSVPVRSITRAVNVAAGFSYCTAELGTYRTSPAGGTTGVPEFFSDFDLRSDR